MLVDRYALEFPLSAIICNFSKKVRVRLERRTETTRAYRLPACLRSRVSKKWRCVFVWRRAQARVNKVKHLSRVNGNINTPRRLRLETSRANERRTLMPQGWQTGRAKSVTNAKRWRRIRGRFLSVEKVESKRFKVVKVDFNFEAVLKVARATRSLRQTFCSCTYEVSLLRAVLLSKHTHTHIQIIDFVEIINDIL